MTNVKLELTLTNENLGTALEEAESRIIEAALVLNQFNTSRATRALGLSRGSVTAKLKQYFGDKYVSSAGKPRVIVTTFPVLTDVKVAGGGGGGKTSKPFSNMQVFE